MSTRSPLNRTPSAIKSSFCRSPFASDPSARTIRCHGMSGSSDSDSTRPASRGACGVMSEYAATRPSGTARTRSRTSASSIAAYSRGVTYSLVARDPGTNELGVAVQSHWFSVGAVVTHARAGVGAVATQSVPDPSHGPRLLDLLADGASPDDALHAVLDGDEALPYRQTALVDVKGRVAVYTGEGCMPDAGHTSGDGWSAQANIMLSGEVWPAMAEAFVAADPARPLAERLLTGLDAAQAAGGDVRGMQSAAVLVVPAIGEPWRRTVDLRVEDHPQPLAELRRLVTLNQAYSHAGDGDELMAEGRLAEAGEQFIHAAELAPDKEELQFWAGLAAASAGDVDGGIGLVREALARNPGLRELLDRLGEDLAPAAPLVRERLSR